MLSALRIIAIFVLLFSSGEMLMCEMTDTQEAGHHDQGGTDAQHAPCHDCFCSGAHVLPATTPLLLSGLLVVPTDRIDAPRGIERPPLPVYHPPKA